MSDAIWGRENKFFFFMFVCQTIGVCYYNPVNTETCVFWFRKWENYSISFELREREKHLYVSKSVVRSEVSALIRAALHLRPRGKAWGHRSILRHQRTWVFLHFKGACAMEVFSLPLFSMLFFSLAKLAKAICLAAQQNQTFSRVVLWVRLELLSTPRLMQRNSLQLSIASPPESEQEREWERFWC